MEKQTETAKPTLKELLTADSDRFDLAIPERGNLILRKAEAALLGVPHPDVHEDSNSARFLTPYPRLKLWLPPTIPLVIVFLGYLAVQSGHQFNIHGDAAGVFFLIFLSSIIALIIGIKNLPSAINRLSTVQSERTFVNYACTIYALVFCTVCLWLIAYAMFRIIMD